MGFQSCQRRMILLFNKLMACIMRNIIILMIFFVCGGLCFEVNGQTSNDYWIEVNTNNDWFHHPVGRSIDTVYMASQHGVYRSVDHCQTWQCIGLEDRYINILYLSEDGELYACTNNTSSVFRWNGSGWDVLQYQSFSLPQSFLKSSDGALFLGDNQGIFRSIDGGDTWSFVWENPNEFGSEVNGLIEVGNGTLFACLTNACDYHNGVIRSTNHGDTWENVGLDDNYLISLAKNSDGIVYAGCVGYSENEDVGVFRTNDNGNTWEKLNSDYSVYSIVIDDNGNVYIANGDFQGLFRSSDGGYSFDNVSSGMDSPQTSLSLLSDGCLFSYEYNLTVFFGRTFRSCESVYTSFELDVMAEPLNGGVVCGSGTYYFGDRVCLSALPNENYQFVGWVNQDGDTLSKTPELFYTMTNNTTIIAHFSIATNLEEMDADTLCVWPNPTTSNLYISECNDDTTISLFDIYGRSVLVRVSLMSRQLDLSQLSSGTYHLIIKRKNKITRLKVIKQ